MRFLVRIEQIHDLVESIDVLLKKAFVKNTHIHICVKDHFLLHPNSSPKAQKKFIDSSRVLWNIVYKVQYGDL